MAETSLNLFGDSLNPKQVLQKRLAQSISESQDLFKKAPPSQMMGATLGATLGGLFGNVLMEKGVIPESPEFAKAKKMEQAKSEVDALAKEAGVSITDDPVKYFSLAADRLANIGLEAEAIKAVEISNLYDARKRAKEIESAKIGQIKAETEKAMSEAERNRRGQQEDIFGKVDQSRVTQDSMRKYLQTGNRADLVFTEDPQKIDKDAQRAFDQASKLRNEYIQGSKVFTEVRDAHERIKAAAQEPTGPGDIALLTGFMKLIDPTTGVKEGEFATARNAGSVPESVRAAYNKALSGELLDPKVRTDFVSRANKLYQSHEATQNKFTEEYSRLAKGAGVNESLVIVDFGNKKEGAKTIDSESEKWISDAMKANPSMTREQVVEEGRKRGRVR